MRLLYFVCPQKQKKLVPSCLRFSQTYRI